MPAPPAAAPATPVAAAPARPKRPVGLLAAVLLLLLVGGGGAVRYRDMLARLLHPAPSKPAQTHVPARPDRQPASAGVPAEMAAAETEPAAYLPLPYRSYRYYEWYPDGDKGEWTQTAASLQEPIPVSTIELPAGLPASDAVAYHYLQKGAAIYRVADARPREAELLLDGPLRTGTVIKSAGMTGTVTATGATCTAGGRTYTGCLVIDRNYIAADYRDTEYWAPGHGIVLVKAPGGSPVRILLGVKEIDAQDAVDRVMKAAPNIDKVRVP